MELIIMILFSFASLPFVRPQYEKPCLLSDYKCMTTVLAANSACDTLVFGSIPDEITFVNTQSQIPYANMTFVNQYEIYSNLDKCYVSAFFFNLTSDVAVIGLNCPNLRVQATQTLIRHEPNNENRYYSIKLDTVYPLIQLTANLRPATDLDLCRTRVYTYINELPTYIGIPNNPATAAFLKKSDVTNHVSVIVRENFLNKSRLFYLFIDFMLCNFGCAI